MTSTTHREFFGDAERDFRLTYKQQDELERICGAGMGSLCKRLFDGHWRRVEICETIRLALIGAGADPLEAKNLVDVYAVDAPLGRVYPLAVNILHATYCGVDDVKVEEAPNAA